MLGFGKDFRGKQFDANFRVPPGPGGQSGFSASLLEEAERIPTKLDSNLGEQETAGGAKSDRGTMNAGLETIEHVGRMRNHRGRQNGKLDFEKVQFAEDDGGKPRVA